MARGYNSFRNFKESGEEYFVRRVLAPTLPEVCIDIGACVGNYSQLLLKNTVCKVIAFEPLPHTRTLLSQNLCEFRHRTVVEELAVGSRKGRENIYFSQEASSHASLMSDVDKIPYVVTGSRIQVNVVTLDTYVEQNRIKKVNLIKIDSEGLEFDILLGAKRCIELLRPDFIQIEMNWHQLYRGHSLKDFTELLPNYSMFQLTPSGMMSRKADEPLSNLFLYSNFVFARKALL